MSRRHCPFVAGLQKTLCILTLVLAVPTLSFGGVITVTGNTYSLDGGKPVTGPWEIAEQIAVSKDVAIVVMEKKANQTTIEIMLKLLESLHVPTVLTKKEDFKPLVDRGVLKPTRTPRLP